METQDELITFAQAVREFHLPRYRVYQALSEGQFDALIVVMGRRRYVPRKQFAKLLKLDADGSKERTETAKLRIELAQTKAELARTKKQLQKAQERAKEREESED